jgi:serine palmitoyltransferase
MDLHEVQSHLHEWLQEAAVAFQKVPGSAVLIRYVRSSYQNDPVRSAIELVLFIFFIRYLLSPSYSTSKQNYVKFTEAVSLLALGRTRRKRKGADGNGDRKSTSW